MIIRFAVYGAVGCMMEIFWTGLAALLNKNYRLSSTTSVWMFFIYGMVVFLEPVFRIMSPMPFWLRGAAYTLCIFVGEFVTGGLMKRANFCPWDYSGSRYQVLGVIRLDYAPVWFAVGLLYERVFFMLYYS